MLMLQATRTAGSRLFNAHDQDLLAAAAAVIGRRLAALPPLRGAEETRPDNAPTQHLAMSPATLLGGQNPMEGMTVANAEEEFLDDSEAVASAENGLDSFSLAAKLVAGVAAEHIETGAEGWSASGTGNWGAAPFTVSGAGNRQMETVTRLETVPEDEEAEELEGVVVQQCALDSNFDMVQVGSSSVTAMANGVQGGGMELVGKAALAPAAQLEEAWGWAEAAGLQVDEMFTVARQAEGLFHYAPQEPDELAVRPGQRLSLLGLAQPGWYLADAGENRTDATAAAGGRRVGLVPSNFIRLR
jgi:hypothetical protein